MVIGFNHWERTAPIVCEDASVVRSNGFLKSVFLSVTSLETSICFKVFHQSLNSNVFYCDTLTLPYSPLRIFDRGFAIPAKFLISSDNTLVSEDFPLTSYFSPDWSYLAHPLIATLKDPPP